MYIKTDLKNFKRKLDQGYLPVWISLEDNEATIDLVYPSRLEDGKTLYMFIEIENLEEIIELETLTQQAKLKWCQIYGSYLENIKEEKELRRKQPNADP